MKSMLSKITVALLAIFVSIGCGGGGGGGGDGVTDTTSQPQTYDATGTWSIEETTTEDNMFAWAIGEVHDETYTITQTGTTFHMETNNHGSEENGKVGGSEYTYVYSYTHPDFGTITIDGAFTLTSETTLQGTYKLQGGRHRFERSIVGTKTCTGIAEFWEGTYSENYCGGGDFDENLSATFRSDCSAIVDVTSTGDTFEGTYGLVDSTIVVTLPDADVECGAYKFTGIVDDDQITGTISSTEGSTGTFDLNKVK